MFSVIHKQGAIKNKRGDDKMKLWHVTDVAGLFKVIDQCTGKVELIGEDIRINLKSKLSQYFALAEMFSSDEIPELEIQAYNQEDVTRLVNFMVRGVPKNK